MRLGTALFLLCLSSGRRLVADILFMQGQRSLLKRNFTRATGKSASSNASSSGCSNPPVASTTISVA